MELNAPGTILLYSGGLSSITGWFSGHHELLSFTLALSMGLVLVLLGSVLLVLCWAWLLLGSFLALLGSFLLVLCRAWLLLGSVLALLGSFLGVLCWSLVLGCSLGDSCHLAMLAIVWQMVSLVLSLVMLSCYLLLWCACA